MLAQKMAALLLLVGCAVLFDFQTLIQLYIVLGQAHFGLTYFYQWQAGKVRFSLRGVGVYLALLLSIFWLVWHYTTTMTLLIVAMFLVHYYLDEFKLNQEKLTVGNFLFVLPLFCCVILSLQFYQEASATFYTTKGLFLEEGPWFLGEVHHPQAWAYFKTLYGRDALHTHWPWLWGGLVLSFGLMVFRMAKGASIKLTELHILAFTTAAFIWLWLGGIATISAVNGFIILAHIIHWYTGMHTRLKIYAPQKLHAYWRHVALANILIVGGYAYVVFAPKALLAEETHLYYYSYKAFLAWSALHILTTIRVDDYKTLFGKVGERAALGLQAVTRFR